jgi:hypothetical protein
MDIPGKLLEVYGIDEGLSVAVHGIRRGAQSASSDDSHPQSMHDGPESPLLTPVLSSFDYLTVWLINATEHDAFTVHAINDDTLGFDLLPFKGAKKAENGGVVVAVTPGSKLEAARMMPGTAKHPSPGYSLKCSVLNRAPYTPPAQPLEAITTPPTSEKSRLPRKITVPPPPTVPVPPPKVDEKDLEARQQQLSKAMKLFKDLQVLQVSGKAEEEPRRDVSLLRRPTILDSNAASTSRRKSTVLQTATANVRSQSDAPVASSSATGPETPPPATAPEAHLTKKKKRGSKSGSSRAASIAKQGSESNDETSVRDSISAAVDHPSSVAHDAGDTTQSKALFPPVSCTAVSTSLEQPFACDDTPPGEVAPQAVVQQESLHEVPAVLPQILAADPVGRRNTHSPPAGGKGATRRRGNTISSRETGSRTVGGIGRKGGGRRESYARMEKRHSEVLRENKLYEDMYLREDHSQVRKEPSRPRYVRPKSSSVFEVNTFVRNRQNARAAEGAQAEDDVARIIRSLRSRPLAPTSATRGITFATPIGVDPVTLAAVGTEKDDNSSTDNADEGSHNGLKEKLKLVTADVLLEKLGSSVSKRNAASSGDEKVSDGDEEDAARKSGTDTEGESGIRNRRTTKNMRSGSPSNNYPVTARKNAPDDALGTNHRQSLAAPAKGGTLLRREGRPNQIRTLGTSGGGRVTGARGEDGANRSPNPRVSFVEADENNAVLDAVLAPMGRSLLDGEEAQDELQTTPLQRSAGAKEGKDFVDRLLDEAAAKGSTLAGASLLLSRIKSSSASSATAAGGRLRAHTISGYAGSSRNGSAEDGRDRRASCVPPSSSRFKTISLERSDAEGMGACGIGVRIDDSYRASRRSSVASTGSMTAKDDEDECIDEKQRGPVTSEKAAGEEPQAPFEEREGCEDDENDVSDDARKLFLEQPGRFAAVSDDLVNSVAAKIASLINRKRPVTPDEYHDGLEHPSHDLQTYCVPRQNQSVALQRESDKLKAQLADDAEAASLYEEQQRLARIMTDLVAQVQEIWQYEQTESTEQKSNKTFFRLSMDVAWRLQQRRNINLAKLLNLLERKCGNSGGERRKEGKWMPYYRDDNVFVDNDDDDARALETDANIRMTEDRPHRRIISQGFHPSSVASAVAPTAATGPAAADNIFRYKSGAVLECQEEFMVHVQRLAPPGRLEELTLTYPPEHPVGLCLHPTRPTATASGAVRNCPRVTVMQFIGGADFAFNPEILDQQRQEQQPLLSGREIARERLRALRKRRIARFVLMDGTEIESFTRFPSWQMRYS